MHKRYGLCGLAMNELRLLWPLVPLNVSLVCCRRMRGSNLLVLLSSVMCNDCYLVVPDCHMAARTNCKLQAMGSPPDFCSAAGMSCLAILQYGDDLPNLCQDRRLLIQGRLGNEITIPPMSMLIVCVPSKNSFQSPQHNS